jgi:hypothetical protein
MNMNMIMFIFVSNYLIYSEIYTDLYEYVLNLFENMHTAALLHTTAAPDSHTLPRALPHTARHIRALCRTLPHTA